MSKRCLFSACVFVCVFVVSMSPVFAQKGSLSLVPSSLSSPGVGEEFELSVNITGGEAVAGYQVSVAFDPTALAYVSSENADYFPADAFTLPVQHKGSRVELVATSLGGEGQGDGTLAVVRFKVKAVKASTVSLSEALLSNRLGQTVRPGVTGAKITVPIDGDRQTEESLVSFLHMKYTGSVGGQPVDLVRNLLPPILPDSKHKVVLTLTNEQTGKPMPSVGLSLSTDSSSTTTATFKPAVITTDENGQAETEITFGEKPGIFILFVELKDKRPRVTLSPNIRSNRPVVEGEDVLVTHNLPSRIYRPGSTHKVILTVIKERNHEPVPSVGLSLSTDSSSTTTATFKPAVITTDKNGKAQTEITFGEKSGRFALYVDMNIATIQVQVGYISYVGGQVNLEHNLYNLSSGGYLPGSKHKMMLTLTNSQTGKPMPSVGLSLSTNNKNSTATATFKPTVITTDKEGKAQTEITFGKKSGHLHINVDMSNSTATWVLLGYTGSVRGEPVNLEHDLSSDTAYLPGSKHKMMLTLTNAQTGKPMPSVVLSLSTNNKNSTATATFKPAVITTDKEGKAQTEITFGEKAGRLHINVDIPSREVFFLRDETVIDIVDITLDGTPRVFDAPNVSFELGLTKTRKKLVVKFKNARQGRAVVFDTYGKSNEIVKFDPKKVRTDSNDRAVTYVTFEAGMTDVNVIIDVSREVFFDNRNRRIDTEIIFDGTSGLTHTIGASKRGGELVVKFKDASPSLNIVPHVDLVHFANTGGNVKFDPQVVRPDKNGRAVTYITFEAGIRDVTIEVHTTSKLNTKNKYGATVYRYSDGHEVVLIKGLYLSDHGLYGPFGKKPKDPLDVDTPDLTCYVPRGESKHFKIERQGAENTCGQHAARMVLFYYGVDVSLKDLNTWLGAGWETKTFGMTAEQMMSALGLLPVKTKRLSGNGKGYSRRDSLRDKISQSRPPIIVIKIKRNAYHHTVVVGYDTKTDQFLLADPWGFFYWVPWNSLNGWWHLSDQREKNLTWEEFWKERANLNAWGNASPSAGFLLRWFGALAPYRMFVPEKAPPYHHLESQTVKKSVKAKKKSGALFTGGWWRKTITFNGRIGAFSAGILEGSIDKDWVIKGNELTLSGDSHSIGYYPLIVTAYYKPGAAAAPVLALPPKTTALLPNYPNPFNPETWIPYHLAKPADVTLTIYAIDGKVVRHLELGHQVAGFYQSKSRAAYWDGRNDVGERVASGVYFYTLKAGEFAATRKLLILK